jgi:predicted nucleic acid-binding protein
MLRWFAATPRRPSGQGCIRRVGKSPPRDRAAAALYRVARTGGETVRSVVDCLIAAVALRHDVRLVHKDRDFEVLGRITGLQHRSYRSI